MKIRDMNDRETRAHLLKWCEAPNLSTFSWPTDACGYAQHMRFVIHRNNHWHGGVDRTTQEWVDFVKSYALSLPAVPDAFVDWWCDIGSGIAPCEGEDMESHAKRVALESWIAAMTPTSLDAE